MYSRAFIIFLDNTVQMIYSVLKVLETDFENMRFCSNENELFSLLQHECPAVILMNLDLFPRDGIVLLHEIKAKPQLRDIFVVIYSKKQDDFIVELALDSGAVGYISFHEKPAILRLFLRNLLFRYSRSPDLTRPINVDHERFLVYSYNHPVVMAKKEFLLFSLLFNNPGIFFSKLEIANLIWRNELIAQKRTIDVHIYNIRQVLGRNKIQSKKGAGYRFNKKAI